MTNGVIKSSVNRKMEWDILKGIGIILVMFGHALPMNSFAKNLIYGFHMPLFFFCSGAFFKDKPIWSSTVKDLKTLMIPYITFCFVLIVTSIILKYLSNGEGPLFKPLDENCYVLYHTIWFLPCLFLTRFLYRTFFIIHKIWIVTLLYWVGYLTAYILRMKGINLPFFIDTALCMLLFYHLGFLFDHTGLINKRIPIWISLLFLLLYIIIVWLIEPQVNVKDNVFPVYLIVLAMVPIYAIYQICCKINSRFLAYCGVASLVILGLHHPIYDVAMFPLMNRLTLPKSVEYTIIVVTTLGITLIMYQLMVKFTPFLLGKPQKALFISEETK